MAELCFRYARPDEAELLTELRIRDLKMFSDQAVDQKTVEHIHRFYHEKMAQDLCSTLLGYNDRGIYATATVYFYDVIPSNENPRGTVAQITNVWVDQQFRGRGIASEMVRQLLDLAGERADMICLNSSQQAVNLYRRLGFSSKESYMVSYTKQRGGAHEDNSGN